MKNAEMRKHFYFLITGLWYPAALGAGIAWWVQAVGPLFFGKTDIPSFWTLAFALWFLIYHGIWYLYLITRLSAEPEDYSGLFFWSDVISGIALLLGFVFLGLTSEKHEAIKHGLLYVAAGLVPISALLGNAFWTKPKAFWLPVFAVIVAGIGVWTEWGNESTRNDSLEGGLLVTMYVLLAIYLIWPQFFGSHRNTTPQIKTGNEQCGQ